MKAKRTITHKTLRMGLDNYAIFRLAYSSVPEYREKYGLYMEEPLRARDVKTFLMLAQTWVVNYAKEGRRGFEFLSELPSWVYSSMTCLNNLINYQEIIPRVRSGEVTEDEIRKLGILRMIK